jgi:hypothetical protein
VVLDQRRPKTTILRLIQLWPPNCAPTLKDVGFNPIAAKNLGTLAQQMFIWPFSLQRNESFCWKKQNNRQQETIGKPQLVNLCQV